MRYARASRTTAASLGAGPSQPRHAGSAPMRTFLTARGVPLSTSAVSIHHFSATFAGPLLEGSNTDDSFWGDRSEEHTSELQSLMRISYAVFCLKKKKNYKRQTTIQKKSTTVVVISSPKR